MSEAELKTAGEDQTCDWLRPNRGTSERRVSPVLVKTLKSVNTHTQSHASIMG